MWQKTHLLSTELMELWNWLQNESPSSAASSNGLHLWGFAPGVAAFTSLKTPQLQLSPSFPAGRQRIGIQQQVSGPGWPPAAWVILPDICRTLNPTLEALYSEQCFKPLTKHLAKAFKTFWSRTANSQQLNFWCDLHGIKETSGRTVISSVTLLTSSRTPMCDSDGSDNLSSI